MAILYATIEIGVREGGVEDTRHKRKERRNAFKACHLPRKDYHQGSQTTDTDFAKIAGENNIS